jgi:hypothetical protein
MAVTADPAAVTVEAATVTLDSEATQAQVIGRYTAPDGTPLEVRITLFQLGTAIGVGVYPAPYTGAVLRWDQGPTEDPSIIYWAAPA